jgi:hypothetical protein
LALEDERLPGKSASNCAEAEEAVACVQSIMHREPYIEIFPPRLFESAPKEELAGLWRLRVNYLFYQSKKEFYRLPREAVKELLTEMLTMIEKGKADALLEKCNWLKLYAVLFDISRDSASISQMQL